MAWLAQGLMMGVGTGLAWAGVGAATGAVAREAQKRRSAKGVSEVQDVDRRHAQMQAEQGLMTTHPGAQTGVAVPVHPSSDLLNGFSDPSQLPPRFVAILFQRQFACSVDVYSEGKVDGGSEGQHWEVLAVAPGVYHFRCLWNGCYLAVGKRMLKSKVMCESGIASADAAWTLIPVPEQGPGAFYLRSAKGDLLAMDARGKIQLADRPQVDAHRMTVFRFVSAM